MRSLRTWLAIGLVLGITVPAGVGVAAWVAAGPWQAQRELARRDDAVRAVADATQVSPRLADRLAAMGGEAELGPALDKLAPGVKPEDVKRKYVTEVITTPGLRAILDSPDGKQRLQEEFTDYHVATGVVEATLWIRRDGSNAARWAIALGAAGVGLAAVLLIAVAVLSRWVLRPLASLARDADRIAGGELAVEPVSTRAREVAQVGDALSGMAGALESALGASAAAEHDRRFLVSAIAHDLRTPLFTLRGSLEAIERGIGDAGALERAQRKADHLDRLVGDLFAFSRAEYARERFVDEPFDLVDVARCAAETVAPRAAAELVLVAPAAVPLRGDPVALERVLTNVLDNAVRHARSLVTVHVRGAAAAAEVEVADDGPGFAEVDLPHVFEPLFRGDRARSGGGAGLGLAIARRLARAHGGDVVAANHGGARVTVTLPLLGCERVDRGVARKLEGREVGVAADRDGRGDGGQQ